MRFPDRASYATVEEYDKNVKKYWQTIDTFRHMASELHDHLMTGKAPGRPKPGKDVKGKIS